ncbi:hypothetical protein P12x_002376 [Tundrisphaera lichenicola]|uniref:hypothetical protein n=1 Tax=Tundrisphaera lichenicola TaxID=2029860 RepID=UPI003EC05F5E
MRRRFWSPEVGIGLGIWLYLMVVGRSRLFRDPGSFWHKVVGRRILDGAGFFATDPFSFTQDGRPWIAQQWLGECAMAVVDRLSGLDGLLLGTVTILAVLYAWMAHRLLRGGLGWLPSTVLVLVGVGTSAIHFHVRPMIATIFAFGLTCAWLVDVDSGRRPTRWLWWLVPVFLIWTNTHGGVLGGLATLALAVGGWWLLGLAGRDSPASSLGRGIELGSIVGACGLTFLVNPYGVRMPASWVEIMASPVIPRMIIEHAPPRADDPATWMIGGLGLIYGIALVGVPVRRWRVTWLIAPIWLALTISRVRNAPLFGVAALVGLADIIPESRLGDWLGRPGRDLFRRPRVGVVRGIDLSWIGPAVLVAVALGLQIAGARVPVLGRGWAGLDPGYWPVELLPELRKTTEGGARPHFFNEDILGGFLIDQVPGALVFTDDRCELYGDDWLTRYDRAERDPEALMRWLSEYRVDDALVRTGSGYDRAFRGRPGWAIVREAGPATLYRRIESPARGLAGRSD